MSGNRATPAHHDRAHEREAMVAVQLAARDITDERVLAAARRVARHRFVPAEFGCSAYDDRPLPIGHGATISQPYIVALMVQELELTAESRVLEIGTGSGYGAAILAELSDHLVTMETVRELADTARERLAPYGDRVEVIHGDGSLGHPGGAPYDAICVTAAAPRVPEPLLEQLAPGGRVVIPVDADGWEDLVRITRTDGRFVRDIITQVRFVPLVGRHGV